MSSSSPSSQLMQNEEQGFYAVQRILDKKRVNKITYYLVKWQGWEDPKDLTWEPKKNLLSVSDLIEEYQNRQLNEQKNRIKNEREIISQKPAQKIVNITEVKPIQKIIAQSPVKHFQKSQQKVSLKIKTPEQIKIPEHIKIPEKIKTPQKVFEKVHEKAKITQDFSDKESDKLKHHLIRKQPKPQQSKNRFQKHRLVNLHHANEEKSKNRQEPKITNQQRQKYKLKDKVPEKPKPKPEKSGEKYQIARINNFVRRNNQLFYNIDAVINGISIGTQQVTSEQLTKKPQNLLSLVKFLENYITDNRNWIEQAQDSY